MMADRSATGARAKLEAKPSQRAAIAVVVLALAAALLWPTAARSAAITWEDLLRPLDEGATIAGGFRVSPPRRGEEHDVVITARRGEDAARVEVHVVDRGRWTGVRETRSFGVGYETPRSRASIAEMEAVAEAVASAIAKNDAGVGPVDAIPLRAEPPPSTAARVLDRVRGARGAGALAALAVGVALIASLPGGAAWAAGLLFVVGLALRGAHLGVPFTHDQDVQRLFTGALPLGEILTGQGLRDRHPPLYFVLLHAVTRSGTSEAMTRAPAVLAGALAGPAMLGAVRWSRGRAGAAAALAGLAVTVSPELVARSREVSEIPLFALLALMFTALLVRAVEAPSRRVHALLAAAIGALSWTYYLAPLVLAGALLPLLLARKLRRGTGRAVLAGALLGAPALALGAATITRDLGARRVAARFPELAWGEHTTLGMLGELLQEADRTVGYALCAAAVLGAAYALRRREVAPLVALGAALVTALGIALAAPFARVQAYYLAAVAPLVPLALALVPAARSPRVEAFVAAAGGAGVVTLALSGMAAMRLQYVPDADAFMPRFAAVAAAEPEVPVAVVAHYDATLLAYYLERAAGVPASWPRVEEEGAFVLPETGARIVPLAKAHALDAGSAEAARQALDRLLDGGQVFVIERDAFVLGPVHEALGRCEPVLSAPSARMVRCAREGR